MACSSRGRRFFCCLALGISLWMVASAALADRQEVLSSTTSGECTLSVSSENDGQTLRLRAHHPAYKGCRITREEMAEALTAAFARIGFRKEGDDYTSLSIGRLIDYPWLSQYLAGAAAGDGRWDAGKGRPRKLGINRYVADLLSAPEVLQPLATALGKGGYQMTGAMVEKVLVGGAQDIPLYTGPMITGRVPFDAIVWLRLKKL